MANTKKTTQPKGKAGTTGAAARPKHSRSGSNANSSPNKRAENWNFTHIPPDASQRTVNGRQKGRDLVSWARPRMMEQTMLHLVYEATTRNIRLPWDNIAHRLHPGLSGNALLQRFQRLRRELVAEGHLVPPLPGRGNSNTDPEIRGYTRLDRDGPDLETIRPVRFDEAWLAPQFNLPDAGKLVHNSAERRGNSSKTQKDATHFQLASDEGDTDSEEQDFSALDSNDGVEEEEGNDSTAAAGGEEDNGEGGEGKKKPAGRRAPAHRRQSSRALGKKSYAEVDSADEKQNGSNKKQTPDRRRRGGSSSPIVRRRDKLGRRSTINSTSQQANRLAGSSTSSSGNNTASQSSASGGGHSSDSVPVLFSYNNNDGSMSFHGLQPTSEPASASSSSSMTLPPMHSAVLNNNLNNGGLSPEAFLAMYQLLTSQVQFNNSQGGFSGSTNPNASYHGPDLQHFGALTGALGQSQMDGTTAAASAGGVRSSIFTGQHFSGGPAIGDSQGASGDVTMGGMSATHHGDDGQLHPEQHRLAMAILAPAANGDDDDDVPQTPSRRSRGSKQQTSNGIKPKDNVMVKVEQNQSHEEVMQDRDEQDHDHDHDHHEEDESFFKQAMGSRKEGEMSANNVSLGKFDETDDEC